MIKSSNRAMRATSYDCEGVADDTIGGRSGMSVWAGKRLQRAVIKQVISLVSERANEKVWGRKREILGQWQKTRGRHGIREDER